MDFPPFAAGLEPLSSCDIEFTNILYLPFVPHIGMFVQYYTEIPALRSRDDSDTDGITFKEKVESVTWRDGVIDCTTEDHHIEKDDDIALEILGLMNRGWTVWDSSLDIEKASAVEDFLTSYEDSIKKAEQKLNKTLDSDRETLNKMREVWNFQRLSLWNLK